YPRSASSWLPALLLPPQPLFRPSRQLLVVLGNLKHHALGFEIGHAVRVNARFLRALAPVARVVEATVGHDTPYAAVGFAPVRIPPSMARCQGLPMRQGAIAGESLGALGGGAKVSNTAAAMDICYTRQRSANGNEHSEKPTLKFSFWSRSSVG